MLNVSLTYLRGLEVAELKEFDMTILKLNIKKRRNSADNRVKIRILKVIMSEDIQ